MKTLELNQNVQIVFSVCDGSRSLYASKLEECGLKYNREKIDSRTDRFTIEPRDFNDIYIGQLADIFCSR